MKKSLIFVFIAVLSAGLLFMGCSQGTDSGGSSVVLGGRLVDIEATSETELLDYLAGDDYQIIGVTGTFTHANAIVIPKGKIVVLYTELELNIHGFEVQGELIIEGGGTLIADAGAAKTALITDGSIEVYNGKIEVDQVSAISASPIQQQTFGTNMIRFVNGTLDITDPLPLFRDAQAAFSYVPRGELILAEVTEAVKPSVVAALPTNKGRRLTITAAVTTPVGGDDTARLTIPAGLTFETDDPLTNVVELTVLGNFTADAASFAKLETLTVAGALSAATGGYAKLTNLTIRNDVTIALSLSGLDTLTVEAGELTVPAVAGGVDGLTLTVGAKGVLTLTGALTGLNDSVVSGTLTATGLAFNSLPDVPPTLTATVDAVINGIAFTGVRTNISALATDAVTTGDFEVPENKTLTIPAATTLTIAAGSALTYDGPVTITATGNLVLATASTTSVASIAGTGTISAGVTTIRGSWAAVGETTEAGTVTIQSAAIGATITADGTEATGLKASAAGAIITQSAGASNTLSIGADTTIDLSEFGSLVLRGAASNSGTAKLTADTAIIKGGGGSTDVDESKITSLGGIVKATAIGDDLTFTGSGDGTNDPFGTIIGAASDNTLTAGGAGDDLTLDKTTILVIGT